MHSSRISSQRPRSANLSGTSPTSKSRAAARAGSLSPTSTNRSGEILDTPVLSFATYLEGELFQLNLATPKLVACTSFCHKSYLSLPNYFQLPFFLNALSHILFQNGRLAWKKGWRLLEMNPGLGGTAQHRGSVRASHPAVPGSILGAAQ